MQTGKKRTAKSMRMSEEQFQRWLKGHKRPTAKRALEMRRSNETNFIIAVKIGLAK